MVIIVISTKLDGVNKLSIEISIKKRNELIRVIFHNTAPQTIGPRCFVWISTREASDNITFDQCYRAGAYCGT